MITALYAGLLGLVSIALASAAGALRGKTKISIGDGGNADLLLAMRRHSNFVEYVPLGLILIALLEVGDAPSLAIHILGGVLLVSRILHAIGLKADSMENMNRLVGVVGTMLVMAVASVWSIVLFF